MAARLKVFVTSDGMTDYVVAASSRPKALAAWGSHQDLFKTGLARETDDPALTKAATAQPGEVLRRAAGSRATLARLKPAKAAETPKGPSKATLKKIADLEAKLETAAANLERDLAALEAERVGLLGRHAKTRERLEAQLSAARRARG
jgi:hypothetical protein